MHTVARPDVAITHESPSSSGVSRDRGGSWTLPAPAGAYSQLPAWTSGEAWFDAVLDALNTTAGEECRAAAKVSRDTLLRVAYADRKTADQATGRGVATAHETVAEQLGMSAKTVQRARRLLERLGLAATVVEGRYLTAAERREAHARHGGRQLKAASTRALIMPRTSAAADDSAPVENVYLPSPRRVSSSSSVLKNSPKRAHSRARAATATRRPELMKKRKTSARSSTPRTLATQQLAARIVDGDPGQKGTPNFRPQRWLLGRKHIGVLCDFLERERLAARGWTALEIIAAVDRYMAQTGRAAPSSAELRNPVGFFAAMVKRAIPADAESPRLGRERDRARLLAERREAAAAAARRREEIAEQQPEIDRIIAEMHARFPRTPRPRRYGR